MKSWSFNLFCVFSFILLCLALINVHGIFVFVSLFLDIFSGFGDKVWIFVFFFWSWAPVFLFCSYSYSLILFLFFIFIVFSFLMGMFVYFHRNEGIFQNESF